VLTAKVELGQKQTFSQRFNVEQEVKQASPMQSIKVDIREAESSLKINQIPSSIHEIKPGSNYESEIEQAQ